MKYCITIQTYYGDLTIDDIETENEEEAVSKAEDMVQQALDIAKTGEIYEY